MIKRFHRHQMLAVLRASGVSLLLLACGKSNSSTAGNVDSLSTSTSRVSVGTALVTSQTLSPTIRVLGTVAARPNGYAELSAPGPTRITHVFVAPGDAVHVGQPLVTCERATFDATAQSATAGLQLAQATYDRATRLSALGILPRKAVEQAAADLAQAKATAITARRANDLSTVRSPINGIVTRVSAVQGASVDAPTVLVAVADPTKLDLMLALSPVDAATIQHGANVVLRANETPDAPLMGSGVVTGIGAALDSITRVVPVRVTVRHADRPLRLGETITSDVAMRAIPHALTVPTASLVPAGDSVIVFVIDQGIAHAHTVTVGTRTASAVQILSGLRTGQTVVTSGAFGVQDGNAVTVSPSAPSHP